MLTLARAFARQPRVLLIDELSLGLAPLMVNRLLSSVRQIATEKQIGVLIVEQKVEAALSVSDRAYVMRDGEIVLSGASIEIAGRVRELEESYLASRTRDLEADALTTTESPNSRAPQACLVGVDRACTKPESG